MKLSCKADLKGLSNWSKECGTCSMCLPTSALHYPFERDLANSEMFVDELKKYINETTGFDCIDTSEHKKPDLIVNDGEGTIVARVEAKFLEGKAFMKVNIMLTDNMQPKEVLVIDEPKLLSYFQCVEDDIEVYGRKVPIFVVWKYDRPCADVGGICVFQEIGVLKGIHDEKGDSRAFRRRTGTGDFVSGRRIGVIDKYHYSIIECNPIEDLPQHILN